MNTKKVYLKLFHGRRDPNQDMEDWGTNGPIFGPADYFHNTYCTDIKSDLSDEWFFLRFVEDMVYYDGVYYGDWSVFSADNEEHLKAELEGGHWLETWDRDKAMPPKRTPQPAAPLMALARQYRGDVEGRIADLEREKAGVLNDNREPTPLESIEDLTKDFDDQIAHWQATLQQIDAALEADATARLAKHLGGEVVDAMEIDEHSFAVKLDNGRSLQLSVDEVDDLEWGDGTQTVTIKAAGGDRAKNLEGIAVAIQQLLPKNGLLDHDKMALDQRSVRQLWGWAEQMKIIANELK